MKHRNSRGVALIMVLALLVLLSAIVIAFLSSVTTDVAASKNYEGQTSAREVADSAVNLVISQIRRASTQEDQAWISQPGLVRTFDQSGQTGAYKLYSSAQFFVAGPSFDPADTGNGDLPPDSSWSQSARGLWTDINEPVVYKDKDNVQHRIYPIVDQNSIKGDGTIQDVDGFEVQQYAARQTSGLMPVRWLYMLQDGTLLPATSAGDNDVTVTGSVTAANPIIARIAFWTDDETCKLNINTASEGVFWDTPIANSQPPPGFPTNVKAMFEMDLANYMPASREYQRFPGHPAQTSLYPVFGQSLMRTLGINPAAASIPPTSWANYTEKMYEITPRVSGLAKDNSGNYEAVSSDISSRGGTKRAGKGSLAGGSELSYNSIFYALNNDTDRLYATVDELFFSTKMVGDHRDKQILGLESSSDNIRKLVERSKFFLTATSKAPEQNAFNRPRVSIWPITLKSPGNDPFDTQKMTPFDKLFAFCSTVGTKAMDNRVPFFFTRFDPSSMSADWTDNNAHIFDYLFAMCGKNYPSAEGGEGKFTSKYSGGDMKQI
ncbi:MAG: Verru_Chthon cassette protein A, partial [Bradyrhizobium sp.]